MPSGYTAVLEERDVTFEDFLWRCAKGFYRDREDSLDGPVPEKYVFDFTYEKRSIAEDKKELAKLEKMSLSEAREEIKASNERASREWEKSNKKTIAAREKYLKIREKIVDWVPPTKDHEELKKFMLEQMDQELRWTKPHDFEPMGTTNEEVRKWIDERIVDKKRSLAATEMRLAEKQENEKKANEWLAKLKESVPVPKKLQS